MTVVGTIRCPRPRKKCKGTLHYTGRVIRERGVLKHILQCTDCRRTYRD